jgi:hypothetical protein
MMSITFDGRTARKQKGVDQMLYCGLVLVKRGNWRPTAKQVAAASGISVRTFFANFGTVEDYYKALLERHETSLRACLPITNGPLCIRIAITGKPTL